jgi:hypothetical protein
VWGRKKMAERHVNFEGARKPPGPARSERPSAQIYEIQPRDNREAIDAGIQFLSSNHENRHWSEFTGALGSSDLWITAVVVAELSVLPAPLMTSVLRDQLQQSGDWLQANQNEDGGWGFRRGLASDAESTAWAMLALRGQERALPESALHFLHRCRRADGGTGLFPASFESGPWSKPGHPDVTALIARVLKNGDASAENFLKTCWLQTNRPLPQARLQSRFHTFSMLLEWEAMPASWPMLEKLCELMASNRAENAFDQALLLRCLTALRIQKASSVSAGLRRMQLPDGGWPCSATLHLTDPGTEATGPVGFDDQRTLTTAAAVMSLARSTGAKTKSNHQFARTRACGY